MKYIILLLSAWFPFTSFSQVVNGSFENGPSPDLSNWEWTCGAESVEDSPGDGGKWCIKVWGGNFQSCFPGYAYQKLPWVTDGLSFMLSGWARTDALPPVGLYFGKINHGLITLLDGDTTSSKIWTPLNILSTYSLSPGDTALVVLNGGQTGGPVQAYGYFDLIDIQMVNGLDGPEKTPSINIFPNPFTTELNIRAVPDLEDATLTIINLFGQVVKELKNISGGRVILQTDPLPAGVYLLRIAEKNRLLVVEKIFISD